MTRALPDVPSGTSSPSPLGALALASVVVALVAIVALAFLGTAGAYPDGVSPPEGCKCHGETPSPGVRIQIEGWPGEYTPDTVYSLRLAALGQTTGTAGGFASEVSKGGFQNGDEMVNTNGRFATHKAPDKRAWSLEWRAPPEDSGNVTLTVFGNQANGDGTDSDADQWNTLQLSVKEKAPEPPKPSTLLLTFSAENGTLVAGRNVTLVASLANFTGVPIPKAVVTFAQNTTYGTLAIGQNKTGLDGRAILNWTVVSACECRFFAHYDGSSKNLSSNLTTSVTILDPNGVFATYYPEPSAYVFSSYWGVRGPLGLVVGGVWATLAYAAFAALRVRSVGAPAGDGPRGLLRLLSGSGKEGPK